MGDKFSRIEYETDQIKREFRFNNSKQEFSICFKFCNSFRFIYLYHKQKTKNRVLLYKQQQQKSQRGYL
jgi:hypothetical protein